MQIKKHIPNLITSGNLVCGALAIISVSETDNPKRFITASLLIILAAIFDFFDGFAARLLNVQSEMGKQMDSLADMVTFGFAPGLIVYQLLLTNTQYEYLPYIGLLIPVFSAFRLAKFNIDTRQSTSFLGLPTPANALFWISIPLIIEKQPTYPLTPLFENQWFITIMVVILSIIMVSELPLFSLKFKSFDFKENKTRYIFILSSILLLIVFYFVSIPFIIILYIILSLINNRLQKNEI